jgi:hypothetical protein
MSTAMDEAKARRLLRHGAWALATTVAAVLPRLSMNATGASLPAWAELTGAAVFWVAGVFFYVCLGRLASGLGQSVALWVIGTWLATGALGYVAGFVTARVFGAFVVWLAAWLSMRSLVQRTFGAAVDAA